MIRSFKSAALGLLILPLTMATFYRLPSALLSLQSEAESLTLIFIGVVAYILIESVFERPMRTYVFGHELTHALAAMAMGGEVKRFHVSEKGGSVTLTKTNFIVALAPYCLPIYTLFIVLIYAALNRFYPSENLDRGFMISVGATLAFHASLTLYAIRQRQPDIQKTGNVFSIIFILLINAWVLAALSKALFWKSFAVKDLLFAVWNTHWDICAWVWARAVDLIEFLREKVLSRHPRLP